MTDTRFWNLCSPESTRKLAEWVHEEMDLESVVCPIEDGHQRAGKRLTDLSVTLSGRTIDDFVWTWYSECLVQDRVLEVFRTCGLTGYDVKPVKARFKRRAGEEPPRLWELVTIGWAGMAPVDCGIGIKRHCNACGSTIYTGCSDTSKLISTSQWDGSDFFMVWPLPGHIFVTPRAVQAIQDNRLSGAILKPVEALDLASGTFSPGRLSYWMPEDRARELGGLLGID